MAFATHLFICNNNNKTGLQPVSRPVEQILGFYPKGLNSYSSFSAFQTEGRSIMFGFLTFGRIFWIWHSDSLFLQKFSRAHNSNLMVDITMAFGFRGPLFQFQQGRKF